MRRTHAVLFFLALVFVPVLHLAAQEADIHKALAFAREGRRDDAEKELRRLEERKRDDPAVLYLRGVLSTDAEVAIGLYQRVVNEHPKSSWADDALYRLYQYSYAVGAYRTARQYEDRLRRDYPKSPYLSRSVPPAAASADGGGKQEESPGGASTEAEPSTGEAWSIQVAAYNTREEAERYMNELKERHGYTLEVREKKSGDRSVYAVWIGVFSDRKQARDFMQRIREKYKLDGILVRR